MMKELLMNEDFADVTLVTEDRKQIKANISILSTSSPVFKDILKKDKNSSQTIYLRGIQHSEMESILQFIYLGQATFYEERMNEVLAVAKSLEIKQLCNAESDSIDELKDEPCDPLKSTENFEEQTFVSDQMKVQAPKERQRKAASVNGRYEGVKYTCDQCEYQGNRRDSLTIHIQSKHEGVKYTCDQCDYQANRKDSLTIHIQSKHEGVKYACDQCDYRAAKPSNLTAHIRSQHEGVKYACDHCNYRCALQQRLMKHIQSVHEAVMYACDQCDYLARYQVDLSTHIQSKHEGINYSCDQCDYQATTQSNLTRHIRSKH